MFFPWKRALFGAIIYITTTKVGSFSISLTAPNGIILPIDWGDGTIENKTMTGAVQTFYHTYTAGGTLRIYNAEHVILLYAENQNVTSVIIPKECVNMLNINLQYNSLTTFDTHSEMNVQTFLIGSNDLTSLVIPNTWTNLTYLAFGDNNISSFTTYATWVNLLYFLANNNSLTSITTYAAWTSLSTFNVSNNILTSITLRPEWTNVWGIFVGHNSLTSITTYSAWVNLYILDVGGNSISSITTHVQWVSLHTLYADACGLSTLTVYSEWTTFTGLEAGSNAITSTPINNIFIEIDSLGTSSGSIGVAGGTNAIPTGAGLTAKNNLVARGWTIYTN